MHTSGISAEKTNRPWLKVLAGPGVIFYTLPWLMLLLIVGTVLQRDLGLYDAQRRFFSAWIVWLGPLPLPGAYTALAVITLGLLVKFLFYSPWRLNQSGIILSHLGVLVLLIGGMLTALTQSEAYMPIKEGEIVRSASDYHDRIITIAGDGRDAISLPFADVAAGTRIPGLPFAVTVDFVCRNCTPVAVKEAGQRRGLAAEVSLRNAPNDASDEANLSGIEFTVTGSADADGTYLIMEEIPHTPDIDGHVFSIGRRPLPLPFALELKDFRRKFHPGTDMPRGFSSDVVVHDGGVVWPYHIRMNEPLRYKGYTFYQASFSVRPDGEYSVLSVVRNEGRIFPYIASALLFAGLLLHVVLRLNLPGRRAA